MVCDSALLSLENIQLISNLKWITRVPMTLKKTKETIGSYLEKVKVSQETDPKIQEMTREFQKKGYKHLCKEFSSCSERLYAFLKSSKII
jgi:transposase